MGWADHAIGELAKGNETLVTPRGHSMQPRVVSGQRVLVRPVLEGRMPAVGNVVLVRVRGRTLLHLVSAVDGDRVQISNNKGRVNGWVNKGAVYGVADV